MRSNRLIIAVGLLTVFLVCGVLLSATNRKIKSGVRIEGISFSGYTKESAKDRLKQLCTAQNKNTKMHLAYGDKVWEVPYEKIRVRYNIPVAVETAYRMGRDRNALVDFFNSAAIMLKGYDVQVQISFDKGNLRTELENIAKSINRPCKDAAILVNKDGGLEIVPEEMGIKLDVEKSMRIIEGNITPVLPAARIELPVIQSKPKYTADQLKAIEAEVGSAATSFNTGEANRSSNIRNALARINGTLLTPGDIFSLNSALGPRNENNGYKSAPVILNNELVPGMGGGVCQVATTMYNAVLQAGLEVMERQHHTFPPAYVPVGQDATIAGSYIDFKFKNNTGNPIFIFAEAPGSKIAIKFFSKRQPPGRKVKVESQVLNVEDPGPSQVIEDSSLAVGTTKVERKAKKGYRVVVYRNIYEGSKLVKREPISNDYYKPIRGIVKIGTAAVGEPDKDVINQNDLFPDGGNDRNIEEPDNPPDKSGFFFNIF